jgi:parallel beta-helix repeat protein
MKRMVRWAMLTLPILGILAFNFQLARCGPRTWIVDDDGPADFQTIQEAINAASPGEVVYVRSGVYYEQIEVNKSLLVMGENKFNTILDGQYRTWPVKIKADCVTFSGFTVKNSTRVYGAIGGGIYLINSNNCTLTDNIITDNQYGIALYGSSNNTIHHNLLIKNAVNILLHWDTIAPSNNAFTANVLTEAFTAFHLDCGYENRIIGNIIANNSGGIFIYPPTNNTIIYYNNFINNTIQAKIFQDSWGRISKNFWDDGYPSGGNYWSDYIGVDYCSGPNQNETGSDGIGDASYVVDAINVDMYPLMGPLQTFDIAYDGVTHQIHLSSNFAISSFNFDPTSKLISLNGTYAEGVMSFCRLAIPIQLLSVLPIGNWTVSINNETTSPKVFEGKDHLYLYFTHMLSPHIPIEFLIAIILSFLSLPIILAFVKRKARISKGLSL